MAFVKVQIPRTSQPQDACGLDRSHPLYPYLVAALDPVSNTDLVTGRQMTVVGASTTRPGPNGIGVQSNNASLRYVTFNKTLGAEVSQLFVFNRLVKNGTYSLNGGLTSSASPQNASWLLQVSTGNLFRWNLAQTTSASSSTSTYLKYLYNDDYVTGIPAVLAAVVVDQVAANQRIYFNGENDYGAFSGSTSGSNAIFDRFCINGVARSTNSFAGPLTNIALGLLFDCALTPEWVKSLSENPWQLWEPEELTIWVPDAVGAGGTDHLITPSSSQQINTASAGTITQTHLIGAAHSAQTNTAGAASVGQTHQVVASGSTQANTGTACSVSQGSITQVTAANSTQTNSASAGSIAQAHLVGAASSSTAHTGTAATVSQTHLISAANSQQANTATPCDISQGTVTLVSVAAGTQPNTAAAASVSQTHLISASDGSQATTAGAAGVTQTHLVGAASSTQPTACDSVVVAQGSATYVQAANSASANVAGQVGISQTHLVGAASSTQPVSASSATVSQDSSVLVAAESVYQANTSSQAAITQTHLLVCAPVAVDNIASASAIVQTHLIGAADISQSNRCSAASASNVAIGTDSGVTFVIAGPVREFTLEPGVDRASVITLAPPELVFTVRPGVGPI